ncbi:MAG: SCO family protein [Candidatus Omnitrophica bacterium]|nr:SCO family protein [Candidatus Omnitrophota bacterium]
MERIRRAVWNGPSPGFPRDGSGSRGRRPRDGISRWAIALVVGLGVLWHYAPIAIGAKPTVLPDYGRVPPFALTNQKGEPVALDALLGHVWIADFIFTRCAGQCPMLTKEMSQLAHAFQSDPSVQFVSFTVDPRYDTPEVLSRYVAASGVSSDRWIFLTGEEEAIQRLSQEGFRLAMGAEGPPEEPITHSSRLVLVDRDGAIRGYYEAADARDLAQLRRDAQRLLRHPS